MNLKKEFLTKGIYFLILSKVYTKQGCNLTELCQMVDYTYSHTFNAIKNLKKAGIINIRKKGRNNSIRITMEGMELSKLCHDLFNHIDSFKIKDSEQKAL